MYSAEDNSEEKDDFQEFYQQYRPRNQSSFSPGEHSNYSYTRPVIHTGQVQSEAGTGSYTDTFSSGYSSGQAGSSSAGPVFRRRMPAPTRSRSQGRDYTRADLMSYYNSRPRTAESEHLANYDNHIQANPEDTISRDSGHSSGGTPEFGRRSFVRYNSFPQPGQVTRAEVYNTQNINSEDLVQDEFTYSNRRPIDSYSLYDARPDDRRNHGLHFDSMSLQSFDVNKQNYRENRTRPIVRPRRKRAAAEKGEYNGVEKNMKTDTQKQEIRSEHTSTDLSFSVSRYSTIFIFAVCLVLVLTISLMFLATFTKWQCSTEQSQSLNMDMLTEELSSNLIGQHLVSSQVLSHLKSLSGAQGNPVEVFILLGPTGSGKTLTASIISHVFPIQSNIHHIEHSSHPRRISDVTGLISQSCGYSLVIVDDLDQEDEMVVNSLEKMIVTVSNDSNSKSRGTLLVITTLRGGEKINKFLLEISKDNLANRDKVTSKDIFKKLEEEGINLPLHRTLLDYNIPVRLVPFLPLTRDHVRECVGLQLKHSNIQMNKKQVNSILDQMLFFSPDFPIFSKTGCKHVSAKVNMAAGGKRDL